MGAAGAVVARRRAAGGAAEAVGTGREPLVVTPVTRRGNTPSEPFRYKVL